MTSTSWGACTWHPIVAFKTGHACRDPCPEQHCQGCTPAGGQSATLWTTVRDLPEPARTPFIQINKHFKTRPNLRLGLACYAVPFTPSQGVKTPSPDAHAARCHLQQSDLCFKAPPAAAAGSRAKQRLPCCRSPGSRALPTGLLQAWAPAPPQARWRDLFNSMLYVCKPCKESNTASCWCGLTPLCTGTKSQSASARRPYHR